MAAVAIVAIIPSPYKKEMEHIVTYDDCEFVCKATREIHTAYSKTTVWVEKILHKNIPVKYLAMNERESVAFHLCSLMTPRELSLVMAEAERHFANAFG